MEINVLELKKTKIYALQLDGLAGTLEGSQYIASLTIKGFTHNSKKGEFRVELLKELYSYNSSFNINGFINKTSFEEIKKKIAYGLSWRGGSYDYDAKYYPEARELIFWDIIQRSFEFPADECFEYLQSDGQCVFGGSDWLMWDYCFILIKKNTGLVLLCGAGPY